MQSEIAKTFGDYSVPMFFIAERVCLAAFLFWLIDPTQAIRADEAGPADAGRATIAKSAV